MADYGSPFDSIFGKPASLRGVEAAQEGADRRQAETFARADAERQRLEKGRAEMTAAWQRTLQQAGGDANTALRQFIMSPAFFSGSGDTPAEMMKTINDLMNPKAQVVGEGGALVSPGGQEIYKNPRTFAPQPSQRAAAEDRAIAQRAVQNLGKVQDDAQTARMDQLAIDQLAKLNESIGTGGVAVIKGHLARFGIALEGASDIQVFESLIDKLTPAQRAGTPGAVFDADMRLFKSALPSLIRTPRGNKTIIDSMKALNQDRLERGKIAEGVFEGRLTVPVALERMRSLPDPLARFKAIREKLDQAPPAPAAPLRIYNPRTRRLEAQQ